MSPPWMSNAPSFFTVTTPANVRFQTATTWVAPFCVSAYVATASAATAYTSPGMLTLVALQCAPEPDTNRTNCSWPQCVTPRLAPVGVTTSHVDPHDEPIGTGAPKDVACAGDTQ